MPTHEERHPGLLEYAEAAAEHLPAHERENFKTDYIETMQAMNDKVDNILTSMVAEAVPLMLAYSPHHPEIVEEAVRAYCLMIRKVAQTTLAGTSKIQNHAARAMVIEGLKDVLVTCAAAVNELSIRTEERHEKRMNIS